jgi:hypothetical protein
LKFFDYVQVFLKFFAKLELYSVVGGTGCLIDLPGQDGDAIVQTRPVQQLLRRRTPSGESLGIDKGSEPVRYFG